MNYGYARVSSKDQNLERQIKCFKDMKINEKNMYCDKKSGKDFDRFYYKKLLKKVKPGDLIVIKSIDRLGRDYSSIIKEWNHITNILKVNIYVIDMPLLDTRTEGNNLINKFVSDLVLQILSFVAETERDNIKQRQAEGIALAKKRGVKFGRPIKKLSKNYITIIEQYLNKTTTLKEALILLNTSKNKFFYNIKKYLKKINTI